jgi:hypothetical protein
MEDVAIAPLAENWLVLGILLVQLVSHAKNIFRVWSDGAENPAMMCWSLVQMQSTSFIRKLSHSIEACSV